MIKKQLILAITSQGTKDTFLSILPAKSDDVNGFALCEIVGDDEVILIQDDIDVTVGDISYIDKSQIERFIPVDVKKVKVLKLWRNTSQPITIT